MIKDRALTNKDLFDFKNALLGCGYGTIKPCQKIFGMSRSSYYNIKKQPDLKLSPWFAAHLRVYMALPYIDLIKLIKDAHGIDVTEVKR